MANQATTTYKVTGSRKAVNDLWSTLQKMEVNSKNIWLYQLAEHYGIDYETKQISVRGHIYWAEYEEDTDEDNSTDLIGALYILRTPVSKERSSKRHYR